MKQLLIFSAIILLFSSCKDSKTSSSTNYNSESNYESYQTLYEDEDEERNGYQNGVYSAVVDYNNPNTGYYATYTLDVEVEDNEIVTIYFPNDGYLDEDYIWPEELDEYGYAYVQGENGKTYEVQID